MPKTESTILYLRTVRCLSVLSGAILLAGCRTAAPHGDAMRVSTTDQKDAVLNAPQKSGWHSIVVTPNPDLPKITYCDELNPVWWLGNIDDPMPPDWYRPDNKRRLLLWRFRNPFHNFDFYVIGIADKKFVRSGRYPEHNGNPNGGWDFEVCRRKLIVLPWISYNSRRFVFYLGWRNHGNFGVKINFNPKSHRGGRVESKESTGP